MGESIPLLSPHDSHQGPKLGATPHRLTETVSRIHRFGRIGQMITRASANYEDVEITAVNDPFTDVEYMVRVRPFTLT